MKLLRVDIQDGESQYSEWFKTKTENEALKIAEGITDGFLRAKRNQEIFNISEEEVKVLEKFRVI